VLPSSYWRVDPTQQVVESFTAANDGFRKLIGQIELETEHVLIPIDDMLKALRGPPAQSDSVAPTQPDGVKEIGNKPKRSKGRRLAQPRKRRPRGPDRIWTYIADVAAPQMDVIVKRDGRFQSLAAAAKRLIVLLRSARKKPPHPKTCEEHIKLEYSRWVASVERLSSTTPRRRK
jgi:hypothetical protein